MARLRQLQQATPSGLIAGGLFAGLSGQRSVGANEKLTSTAMPIAGDHRRAGTALVQVDDEQLLRQVAINNSRQSPCQQRVFQIFSAVKNCYRSPGPRGALPQNDSAIGPAETNTLTHRIPVTGNGDRLFRGRTA